MTHGLEPAWKDPYLWSPPPHSGGGHQCHPVDLPHPADGGQREQQQMDPYQVIRPHENMDPIIMVVLFCPFDSPWERSRAPVSQELECGSQERLDAGAHGQSVLRGLPGRFLYNITSRGYRGMDGSLTPGEEEHDCGL